MRGRAFVTDEVEEQLRELIRKLGPNQRLPSEAELCLQMGVGRSTIREAVRSLEKEGLLFKRHGVGTFTIVNRGPIVGGLEVLRGIPNIVRAAGQEPKIITTLVDVVDAPAEIAKALELDDDSSKRVVFARQLHLGDDVPIILGDSFVPANLFRDPSAFSTHVAKFSAESRCLFDVLEQYKIHVKYAVSNVEAVPAEDPVTTLLNVPPGHPLLLLVETHYSERGKPVIYSRDYIESSRYRCIVVRRKI